MSTCDHAAFTDSFLVTSVLRTLTYCPKTTSAIRPRMMITIKPLPMSLSSRKNFVPLTSGPWDIQQLVNRVGHLLDSSEIARGLLCNIKLPGLGPVFANIQQMFDGRCVQRQAGCQRLDGLSFRRRHRQALRNH